MKTRRRDCFPVKYVRQIPIENRRLEMFRRYIFYNVLGGPDNGHVDPFTKHGHDKMSTASSEWRRDTERAHSCQTVSFVYGRDRQGVLETAGNFAFTLRPRSSRKRSRPSSLCSDPASRVVRTRPQKASLRVYSRPYSASVLVNTLSD